MNAVRRKYQTPLERISEVSSPGHKKPQQSSPAAAEESVDPLSMGESYSSYYRIKQEK